MKLLLALATLAGFLALSACSGAPLKLPPIKAKACYTKKGVRVCAGHDGKAIVLEADGGEFNQEANR